MSGQVSRGSAGEYPHILDMLGPSGEMHKMVMDKGEDPGLVGQMHRVNTIGQCNEG